MGDFSEMPWGELQALSRDIAQEVRLRTDRANVPTELAEVSARGRELGVSEEDMVEAVISTRPPEEPAPEEPAP